MPIPPRVENLRDAVHHYSNQGSSISQSRNRRHEQIENVLFESDPIYTAIYLRSKGTILENVGRKACKFFEQQWMTKKKVLDECLTWGKKTQRQQGKKWFKSSFIYSLWTHLYKKLLLLMAWFSIPASHWAIIYITHRG